MTDAKEKMERVFSECRKFFGEIKAMDERKDLLLNIFHLVHWV